MVHRTMHKLADSLNHVAGHCHLDGTQHKLHGRVLLQDAILGLFRHGGSAAATWSTHYTESGICPSTVTAFLDSKTENSVKSKVNVVICKT